MVEDDDALILEIDSNDDDKVEIIREDNKKRKYDPVKVTIIIICIIVVCCIINILRNNPDIFTFTEKERTIDELLSVDALNFYNEAASEEGYYLYNNGVYYLSYYYNPDYGLSFSAYCFSNDYSENNGWMELDSNLTKNIIHLLLNNSDEIELISENYSEELMTKYEITQPYGIIAGYWYDRENNLIYACAHRTWYLYDADKNEFVETDKDNRLIFELEYYFDYADKLRSESGIKFPPMKEFEFFDHFSYESGEE